MSHHLITNDIQIAKIKKGNAAEQERQKLLDYIQSEMAHVTLIEDDILNPTDSLKQLGRYYTSADFEKRILSLLPSNCAVIDNPYRPGFRAIIRPTHDGFETLCPYEGGILPEHSVMQCKTVEVPDPDFISRKKTLDRKDLPKYEWSNEHGFIFDDTVCRPGFKREKQLGRELQRGWRTVLIRLIKKGLLTVDQAERTFGTSNTATWSQNARGKFEGLPY